MSLFSQTLKKEKKKTKKYHNHKPKQTNNNPNPQLEIKKTKAATIIAAKNSKKETAMDLAGYSNPRLRRLSLDAHAPRSRNRLQPESQLQLNLPVLGPLRLRLGPARDRGHLPALSPCGVRLGLVTQRRVVARRPVQLVVARVGVALAAAGLGGRLLEPAPGPDPVEVFRPG